MTRCEGRQNEGLGMGRNEKGREGALEGAWPRGRELMGGDGYRHNDGGDEQNMLI